MRKLSLVVAAATAFVAVPAFAQDTSATPMPAPVQTADTTATPDAMPSDTGPRAPDGSKAFGIEPYFGVMGGWERFDNERFAGVPQNTSANRNDHRSGALIQGVVGVNVPLGPLFVGAEGNVAKGFDDIDWEYGAAGRFGVRAGDSGMIYGKVGYEWVNLRNIPNSGRDYHDITYGAGFEVGPKSIGLGGITGNAGFRLRGEVSTFGDFHSIRPTLGVITHF